MSRQMTIDFRPRDVMTISFHFLADTPYSTLSTQLESLRRRPTCTITTILFRPRSVDNIRKTKKRAQDGRVVTYTRARVRWRPSNTDRNDSPPHLRGGGGHSGSGPSGFQSVTHDTARRISRKKTHTKCI